MAEICNGEQSAARDSRWRDLPSCQLPIQGPDRSLATPISNSPPTALWGFLNQKPRWSFSFRGWLIFLLLVALCGVGTILRVHSFLAINKPVASRILVVEGWITDRAINGIVSEFKTGDYARVYTTGGPMAWKTCPESGGNYAEYCAMRLQRAGIDVSSIVAVPTSEQNWERTFESALALAHYFHEKKIAPPNLNVITVGPHARRTRLLYERALGGRVAVGIIALPRGDYDPAHWWRSSTGAREVISETVAYLHCRLIFSGSPTPLSWKDID